jgi:S-adenosylmethionine synthetase
MTMEAIAGKNPVTHVGKLYNWIAMEIAEAVADLDGVERCYCYLVSRIGHPVSEPYFRDIRIWTADGGLSDVTRKAVDEIVSERLLSLKDFGVRIVREGKLLVL